LLTEHFVRKFSRLSGKEIHGISPEVLPILMSHDFPGNIRELENIIEHAIVVCRDDVIKIDHLPDYLYQEAAGLQGSRERGASLDDMERNFLYEAFRQNHWSRAATAAQLGIHTTTLWRKMKRLHLDLPPKDGRTKND
jgi:transcriptional regulator with PAS, ATPase and Fis domain